MHVQAMKTRRRVTPAVARDAGSTAERYIDDQSDIMANDVLMFDDDAKTPRLLSEKCAMRNTARVAQIDTR